MLISISLRRVASALRLLCRPSCTIADPWLVFISHLAECRRAKEAGLAGVVGYIYITRQNSVSLVS